MNLGPRITYGRVLVLGDYRQTITVVRSLGRAGFEVTLGTCDRQSSTRLSRFVSDVWYYDNATPQRFCDSLEAFLRNERPEFVFTVGETQLRRLLPAAARLEPLSTWINPDFATLPRCFDKSAMYELAPTLGIPTMPWTRFTCADDWRGRAREMGYPVVVKRKDSAAHVLERKALIFHDAAQLDAFLAALPQDQDPGSLLLQKFASGVRHNCHIAAADGRLIAYFQQKVLRTDEPDHTGIGIAGESVLPSAALRAYCDALTRALRYTGIGCIQFLVDERTGEVSFLEFNARMDSTAALPYRMGLDYPLLGLQLAAYRKARAAGDANATRLLPPPLSPGYWPGTTYYWLCGDLRALLQELRSGKSGFLRLAARLADMARLSLSSWHLTFEWADPLPTLHMFWRKFLQAPLSRRLPVFKPLPRA
jgi:predicted ATP-grasp superfamily ATP-dependent carboligase